MITEKEIREMLNGLSHTHNGIRCDLCVGWINALKWVLNE